VAAPFEDVRDLADAGAAFLLFGSGSGVTGAGSQQWHQDTVDVGEDAEAGDHFGLW
jgi:hypothetical protein